MTRTEAQPIQTFGRVSIHRKPGNRTRQIIDTQYVIKLDGATLTTIPDEMFARYFALGYAQGLERGES